MDERVRAEREIWREQVRDDPEIGGGRLGASMRRVRDLLARHSGAGEMRELLDLLNESELGDHPVFLRVINRIAQRLERTEDNLTRPVSLRATPPMIVGFDAARAEPRPEPPAGLQEQMMAAQTRAIEDAMLFGMGAVDIRPGAITYLDPATIRTRLPDAAWVQINPFAAPSNDARAKAEALLREWLSPAQLAEYESDRHFHVTGCDTGKRYRIKRGTVQNVYELDRSGREAMGWCFGPDACLAEGDVMLAQKIALETDETAALARANPFGVVGVGGPVLRRQTIGPREIWEHYAGF